MAEGEIQILAFVGAPAAGKTVAAAVAKEMGIPVITMGDVIRAELRRRELPLSDENAGRVANELREKEGMDAIAKRCIPLIKNIEVKSTEWAKAKKQVIVLDGIRGMAEVEAFKEEFGTDFALVRVDAPFDLRYERMRARGRDDDVLRTGEFKEREKRENRWGMDEAMKKADKVVKNEGSSKEFKEQIRMLLG